ncbi:restriction endonuclease subunit S [Pseudomonas chlororaphis]|uniref:restriction endonuclease subunit S n=1 Tax=Pseudomonas chlororaphis TaxID=587753 RepID=UPI002366FC82|nr:restriction endonuclease subunit S [Pseudomonas chlororaphis]WDG53911.1 restriction endonuclease subunit S [Pseudomonas chlororaphis]WDH90888.1 restriction endonuclease subunit S [Pseudomonas chlororaphis]
MTALLTDNLPLLAGAPNGIKKLRELILELAVRGKLVSQDPSDEPASELLKWIAEEKAQLVAEGKIKKQKALAEIGEEEKPFNLPTNWEWIRLGQLGLVGSSSRVHQKDWQSNGVPFYRAREIVRLSKDGFVENELFISEELYQELSTGESVPKAGDIMLTGVGTIGVPYCVRKTDRFYFKDASVLIFKNYVAENSSYLLKYFISPLWVDTIHAESMGTTVHTLTIARANETLCPLPPLAEQHRIVTKVDELMALCDRLEAQQADAKSAHAQLVQALLDSLTQASDATDFAANWQCLAEHFHTLFTTESSIDALQQALVQLAVMGKLVPQDSMDEPASGLLKRIKAEKQRFLAEGKNRKAKELVTENQPLPPYDIPSGWEWEIMDSIFYISGGLTLGRKITSREMVSRPYLRVANVQRGYLALDVMKEIEVPKDEVSRYLLKMGDLLITEGGDWDKVGRTAIWHDELPECLHQNHVFRARVVTDELESRWAEMYLNSSIAREYFAGSSKQTTNLASINMTQLRSCAFPVPPLAEQRRIIAKLDGLITLCTHLKDQLALARKLNEQLSSVLVERALVADKKINGSTDQEKARTLLAAEIVQKLHCEKRMGRVKLQKVISLAEHVAQLKEIQSKEERYAAGPHDPALMVQVVQALQKNQWFEELELDNRKRFEYRPLSHAGAHRRDYEALWSTMQRQQINELIELMRPWDTARCERVATLYSAWNDLLIEGREANDAAILKEVLHGWNESKLKYSETQWRSELAEMQQQKLLIPTGFGKRTSGGKMVLAGLEVSL